MMFIDKLKKEYGQTIVEFALIVPVFFIFMFGLIDFSRLLYHNILITDASKETLRLASVGTDISLVSNRLKNIAEPITGEITPVIAISNDKDGKPSTKITLNSASDSTVITNITPIYNNTLKTGSEIKISTAYTYKFITPVNLVFGSGVHLESNYYTRLESPPK